VLSGDSLDTITPLQLKELLACDNPPIILDVRETAELDICTLPNIIHIPLGNLANECDQLSQDRLIVTLCHHGYRSMQAAVFLKSHGFHHVMNLNGGIHAWAKQVDQSMRTY
jgi:rhodanese-related sulfurtransferase